MCLQNKLSQSVDAAKENGYNLCNWDVNDIVEDLIQLDSQYKETAPEDLRRCVVIWKNSLTQRNK